MYPIILLDTFIININYINLYIKYLFNNNLILYVGM
jgi:hypothetical protein